MRSITKLFVLVVMMFVGIIDGRSQIDKDQDPLTEEEINQKYTDLKAKLNLTSIIKRDIRRFLSVGREINCESPSWCDQIIVDLKKLDITFTITRGKQFETPITLRYRVDVKIKGMEGHWHARNLQDTEVIKIAKNFLIQALSKQLAVETKDGVNDIVVYVKAALGLDPNPITVSSTEIEIIAREAFEKLNMPDVPSSATKSSR